MRSALLFATVILLAACGKDTSSNQVAVTPATTASGRSVSGPAAPGSLARYSGVNYSQSISIADANTMIGSYLASVNYPSQDSALRSLTFDADTLRRYLADTSIKTLKFFLAHRPSWATGSTYGKFAGYQPAAMTLVIVGLNQNDKYIPNSRNEVYEHCYPCPFSCPNAGYDAFIQ